MSHYHCYSCNKEANYLNEFEECKYLGHEVLEVLDKKDYNEKEKDEIKLAVYAEEILKETKFLTLKDTREITFYKNGIYEYGGHRYATDLKSLAQYAGISVQMMEHWKTLYPGRILELDYENLIAKPEEQTIALASHCGLEWRAACLDFHERVVASYTFSEMRSKLHI